MSRLEELRELAQGQFSDWRAELDEDGWWRVVGSGGLLFMMETDGPQAEQLAKFIAAANPETVLALVAVVKELRAALDLLLERVEPYGIGTTDLGPCFAYRFARDGAAAALASAATWMEE